VPFIIGSLSLSGCAEWLTWTGAGPGGPVVGPAGETEREWPAADSGKEVTLVVSLEFGGPNIDN